jgi:hypothetical protein
MTYTLTLPPRRARNRRFEAKLLNLIEAYGRWHVIRASLFAKRRRPERLEDLPPSLARDLDLPPRDLSLPSQRQHWL